MQMYLFLFFVSGARLCVCAESFGFAFFHSFFVSNLIWFLGRAGWLRNAHSRKHIDPSVRLLIYVLDDNREILFKISRSVGEAVPVATVYAKYPKRCWRRECIGESATMLSRPHRSSLVVFRFRCSLWRWYVRNGMAVHRTHSLTHTRHMYCFVAMHSRWYMVLDWLELLKMVDARISAVSRLLHALCAQCTHIRVSQKFRCWMLICGHTVVLLTQWFITTYLIY